MEIKRLIKENQISNFNDLKLILESSQINLKVKEDNEIPNLFLIHTQDTSNFSMKLVNECNGIIMDKNTLEVVCYTFDKCSDTESINEVPFDFNNLYIERALAGTLVRLFYYNDKWNLSTRKCIDASKSKWLSEKNFSQLFNECIQNYNINDKLNINCCYSFIITHPENNIVVNYTVPIAYHISTRDLSTLNEIDVDLGIPKIERIRVEKENLNNILIQIANDNNIMYEGYLFIDTNFNRWKIKSELYKYVRNIWGNSNNRFYRYLELRKNIVLFEEYIKYFNYDKENFIRYENKISVLAQFILNNYVNKHITKTETKIPYFLAKIIYKLHGDFYKNKVKTNYDKVMMTLLELDAKQVCFMSNHYDKFLDDNNKKNLADNADYVIMDLN